MTIKEVEERSGMTRANIRFYESEGLLTPERGENGYRNYSEDDLALLQKIKLLRALRISLEEIKALNAGERTLAGALDAHLAKLGLEAAELEQSQQVCRAMRGDGAQYETLDAQRYLGDIERLTQRPVPAPALDAAPRVRAPWRRFWARCLDYALYTTLWGAFLSLALNVNIAARTRAEDLLDSLIAILLMFFLEPALLSFFGTTPGKWVLGLRVTDTEDCRLSYSAALSRTWTVFLRGMGLYLPIYSLIRQWKSYKACDAGETLDWEHDSILSLKDERAWRIAAGIGAYAALIGITTLAVTIAAMPKHRGEITVAQFSENYNRFADYYGIDTLSHLDAGGNWVEDERAGVVFSFGGHDEPVYTFSEDNGAMTGMRFSVEFTGSEAWVSSYQNEMILSILSFAKAQKGSGLFANQAQKIVETVSESPFEDFELSAYGVRVVCDVEYSGYHDPYLDMLWPEEGAQTSYSLSFSMYK